jgi:hypothetical protein
MTVRWPSLLLALVLTLPAMTHAASVTMQWDQKTGDQLVLPKGYVVFRCTITAGSACSPTQALPNSNTAPPTTTFTDTTVSPGQGYCWTLWATYPNGTKAQVEPDAHGSRNTCTTIAGTLAPAGPIILAPQGATLVLQWTLPTFTASTLPASALTGFGVWRRDDPSPPGVGWTMLGSLAPTILTWTDTNPAKPGGCYQIQAQYGAAGTVDNGTVCAAAPVVPPTPAVLQPPTNLRLVP